ncbi:MAG: hypothetical protein E7554_00830 [Ruminococcaceae bacterium]|nr:hypothetical protein [Oscillospiraceae bacterium]
MFDNIGSKIKTLAKVLCWVGIAVSVLTGIILMIYEFTLYGLLAMVAGSLLSWVGSFGMYGLGQLIENTDILAGRVPAPVRPMQPASPVQPMAACPPVSAAQLSRPAPVEHRAVNPVAAGSVRDAAPQPVSVDPESGDEFVDMYCSACGELLSFYRRDLQQEYQTCPMCGESIDVRQYRRQNN